MRNLKRLLAFIFTAGLISQTSAQDLEIPLLEKSNIIKYNITGTFLGSYTFAYERVINPKQSFGIAFGVAPNVDLPFKNTLLELFGDNDEAVTAINSTTFSNVSVTPEYRFYVGPKGAPWGFYAATFLRYTNMTHNQTYQFTTNSGVVHTPEVETTFNGFGVGEMIGVQWQLGQSLTLDWWILGPFVGFLNGKSTGIDDMSDMDAQDKADLETSIEAVPIPGWNIDAVVGDGTIDIDFDGLFYGARMFGLCLGYRF